MRKIIFMAALWASMEAFGSGLEELIIQTKQGDIGAALSLQTHFKEVEPDLQKAIFLAKLTQHENSPQVDQKIYTFLQQLTDPNFQHTWANTIAQMTDTNILRLTSAGFRTDQLYTSLYFPFLLKNAQQGDCYSQIMVSRGFSQGIGMCSQDLFQALLWMEKALGNEQENSKYLTTIYFEIGLMYFAGRGIDSDNIKGLDFVEKAAGLGNTLADQMLKDIFISCPVLIRLESLEKDKELIVRFKKYYKKKNDRNTSALFSAHFPQTKQEYKDGLAILKDFSHNDPVLKFDLAQIIHKEMDNGNKFDDRSLKKKSMEYSRLIEESKKNYQDLTPKQKRALAIYIFSEKFGLKKDDALFFELLNQAHNSGELCDDLLAMCYQEGRGVNKNLKKSAYYYEKYLAYVTDLNNKIIILNELGWIYLELKDESKYDEAIKFFEQAIKYANLASIRGRARMWKYGLGSPGKNLDEAFKLYTKACEKEDLIARHERAQLVLEGYSSNIPFNIEEEFGKNASLGYAKSQFSLGTFYLFGDFDIRIDSEKAKYFFSIFLENRDSDPELIKRVKQMLPLIDEIIQIKMDKANQNFLESSSEYESEDEEEGTSNKISDSEEEENQDIIEKKASAREKKETRNIQKALKNQQKYPVVYIEKIGSMEAASDPRKEFNIRDLRYLKEFMLGGKTLKKQHLDRVLKILGADSTKSGYVIDGMVGGHRPHGADIVDKGAVKELQHYVTTILPGEKA